MIAVDSLHPCRTVGHEVAVVAAEEERAVVGAKVALSDERTWVLHSARQIGTITLVLLARRLVEVDHAGVQSLHQRCLRSCDIIAVERISVAHV